MMFRELCLFGFTRRGIFTLFPGFAFVDLDVLRVERIQLIDAVLNLCTYHHPENIQLPAGYAALLL